jgi:ferritin
MILPVIEKAINEQIANELYASNSYLQVASYFDGRGLKVLASKFFEQSAEERTHALKFLHYLLEVGGTVTIGAIPQPNATFASVEDAIARSLKQEQTVTGQINALMRLAHENHDYPTASLLKWFIDEQVEEEASMSELLQLVRLAGDSNLLLVEERLLRASKDKKDADDGE